MIRQDDDTEKLNKIGVNVLYKSFVKSKIFMKDGLECKDKKKKKSKKSIETIDDTVDNASQESSEIRNSPVEFSIEVGSESQKKVKKSKKRKAPLDEEIIDTEQCSETAEKPKKKSKKRDISVGIDAQIADDIAVVEKTKKKKKKLKENILGDDTAVVPSSTFMTCYPAARCGLGMSGKLARIQKLHDEDAKRKCLSVSTAN